MRFRQCGGDREDAEGECYLPSDSEESVMSFNVLNYKE